MGIIKLKNAEEGRLDEATSTQALVCEVSDENTERNRREWNDPAILKEDEKACSVNVKHFVLNNGTEKSVICNTPLNYYDEEEQKWKTIDNSLTEKADCFEAKSGGFTTEISKTEKGKSVKMSGKNVSLAWEYVGIKGTRAGSAIVSTGHSADLETNKTVLRVQPRMNGAAKISAGSNAVYENIEENIDLEYRLQGNNVKENIIVKERAEEYRYLFSLNTAGLKLRLSEDNTSLRLYSETEKENGEKEEKLQFTIPSPYMYDASGERSDDVYYEIEPETDGKYVFAVVADAEWINAGDRAFPVTIDPQIITQETQPFYSFDNYRRICNCGGSSGTNDEWKATGNTTELVAGYNGTYEYKCDIRINKENIVPLYKNIAGVQLKIKPSYIAKNGYIRIDNKEIYCGGYDYISVDITDTYKWHSNSFYLYLMGSINGCENSGFVRFAGTGNDAPVLEIEYITNENVKPTKKSFSLAGIANGTLNVKTGEAVLDFCDVSGEDSILGASVCHVFKKSADDFGVGKNFRLNLHEKFEKKGENELDANYIYTDASGEKHCFKDLYYYLASDNNKVYVDKSKVEIDLEGELSCVDNQSKTQRVYKEERTSSGLRAIINEELEGFKNKDWIERRQDEYKQLEEQVKAYENALKEYVIVDRYTGDTLQNSYCRDYKLNALNETEFENFLENITFSRLVMSSTEAMQFKSLVTQKDSLTAKCDQTQDIVPKKYFLRNQILSLRLQLYEATEELKTIFADQTNGNIINYLEGEIIIPATVYNSEIGDDGIKGVSKKELQKKFCQRNLYIQQIITQENELDEQIKQIGKQITAFVDKKQLYLKQFEDYYREYKNKYSQLTKMRNLIPVNYLTDGKIIKGFNTFGNLVAIYDNYENAVAIEYEDYDLSSDESFRISKLYDSKEKTIVFKYNSENLLSSVTDTRGRKTSYTYDASKRLKTVTFADGKVMTLGYDSSENINRVESSDKLMTKLGYSGVQLSTLIDSSLASSIKNGEVTELAEANAQELSRIGMEYSSSKTVIREKDSSGNNTGNNEYYQFNTDGNLIKYLVEENNKVSKAEKYDYQAYISNRTEYARTEKLNISSYSDDFDFGIVDYEETILNPFNNPASSTKYNYYTSNNTSKAQTTYAYDDDQKCVMATTKVTLTMPSGIKTYNFVEKYNYNTGGDVVRTESYIEGEETTAGKTIEETVYDDKGNVKKSYKYNSLDTSSKFYTESEYAENGQILADIDETGENKTKYEYIDGTNVVCTEIQPNGSRFAYGRDIDDTVTAITQSTEEGEENSNQTSYTCGEVTEVRSGNNVVGYEYDGKRRLTKVKLNSEEAYVSYEYNENYVDIPGTEAKKKTTATYNNGETAYEVKDKRGNVLTRGYGSESIGYIYDKDGNISEKNEGGRIHGYTWNMGKLTRYAVSSSAGTLYEETRTYDGYKELESQTQKINGVTRTYNYAYKNDSTHGISSISTDGWTFKPKTDFLGRSTGKEIWKEGTKIAEELIAYRKVGDHATQLPGTIRYGDSTGGTYGIRDCVKYTYDEMGNISKVYENGSLSVRYTYDKLNRLVREDNRALDKTYLYAYDNNGNILSRREKSFTLKSGEEAEEEAAELKQYTYEGDRMLKYGEEACEYDALGNPTTYRNKEYRWEKGRRLIWANGNTYTYDGEGRRIGKNTITYTYGSEGKLLSQSNGLEFVYDNTGIAGIKYNSEYYIMRKDILGNIIEILDKNGEIIVKYKYDAWGGHIVLDGSGNRLTLDNCTELNRVGLLNPFRYRSYYYDTETGLYYLQTRYYDPEVGRFITIDDISYLAPDTINGLNLYAYCGNNPVMRVDENGTSWWDSVKNWLKNKGRKIGNFLKGGMGILGSRGSLLAGSNLGTWGISVISNAFGFDIGIDKIPDPSLKAKGIWDTFKEGWNGFKYFVKETVWDDWIVDKLGRGFLKGIVWDKGIVPAWNWINGNKWYQILTKTVVLGVIGVAIGAMFTPVTATTIVAAGIIALITFLWEIISQGWNN